MNICYLVIIVLNKLYELTITDEYGEKIQLF